ncbi:MAG: DUF177 domain-containing protein [Dehalococcoidia bacterium]|nr:DUF177 domain-containing protein [Dehalococcoidia bacterium]
MLYNVAQLLKELPGATRDYALDERVSFGSEEEFGEITVRGSLHLLRTLAGILATAAIETAVGEECARCLERYDQPLTLPIQDEFFPQVDPDSGLPIKLPDGEFAIDNHHMLDLSEAIRQTVLINRPIKPLCRPDCQGLCPDCGANRNTDPCDCSAGATDPRWAKLKTMLP